MSVFADEPSTAAWPRRPWFKSIGALLVPVIIFVTIPITGCANKAPTDPGAALADKLAKATPAKTSPAEKLENTLSSIEGRLTKARRKLKAGKPATAELQELSGLRADLSRIDEEVEAEFAHTREVLAKVGSKDKDRIQARVERDYAAKMAHLTDALDAIRSPEPGSLAATPDGRLHAMAELSSWIDSMTPEPVHQPLGTELPHRVVDYEAGPPVLGTAIAPAYAPDTPGAIPSTLPVTPTADDLTQTVEVVFTDDISATANELDRDPVKMYEFVRNTMDFEPYYGSRKGANETLWEKAGNDFDQASLLIALLRYSDIPARYVQGVVEVPIDGAMNWVGVEVPEAAAKLFSAAGVPVKAITSGGRITKLQIEHCWVEAYVPYESYRGVAAGPKAAKKEWVALDPSWKRYADRTGQSPTLDGTHVAREGVLQAVETAVVDTGTSSLLHLDRGQLGALVDTMAASVEASMSVVEPLLRTRARDDSIAPARLSMLPAASPTAPKVVSGEYRSIPGRLRYALEVGFGGEVVRLPLADVAGKQLTVSYVASTRVDQDVLREARTLGAVPAHLTEVAPVLWVGGRAALRGAAVRLGDHHAVDATIREPAGAPLHKPVDLVAGGYYALSLGEGLSQSVLDERARRSEEAAGACASGEEFRVDRLAGGSLDMAGSTYFAQLRKANRLCALLLGVTAYALPSMAWSGVLIKATSLFGVTTHCEAQGLFLDVKADRSVAAPRDGDNRSLSTLALAAGAIGSELEGAVWRQACGGIGVSATTVVRDALEAGVPLLVLRDETAEAALAASLLPEAAKRELRGLVAAGFTVVTPDRLLESGGWMGHAYVVLDETTGASGYMLATGLGGSVAEFQGMMGGVVDGIKQYWGVLLKLSLDAVSIADAGMDFLSPIVKDLTAIIPFAEAGVMFLRAMNGITNSEKLDEHEKQMQLYGLMVLFVAHVTIIGICVGLVLEHPNPVLAVVAWGVILATSLAAKEVYKQFYEMADSGRQPLPRAQPAPARYADGPADYVAWRVWLCA